MKVFLGIVWRSGDFVVPLPAEFLGSLSVNNNFND
jgi:hypothetical protein